MYIQKLSRVIQCVCRSLEIGVDSGGVVLLALLPQTIPLAAEGGQQCQAELLVEEAIGDWVSAGGRVTQDEKHRIQGRVPHRNLKKGQIEREIQ